MVVTVTSHHTTVTGYFPITISAYSMCEVMFSPKALTLFVSVHHRLKEGLSQSEMELKALTRSQLLLEEEIQVKSNSLYIDEVICTQLRQPITIHDF